MSCCARAATHRTVAGACAAPGPSCAAASPPPLPTTPHLHGGLVQRKCSVPRLGAGSTDGVHAHGAHEHQGHVAHGRLLARGSWAWSRRAQHIHQRSQHQPNEAHGCLLEAVQPCRARTAHAAMPADAHPASGKHSHATSAAPKYCIASAVPILSYPHTRGQHPSHLWEAQRQLRGVAQRVEERGPAWAGVKTGLGCGQAAPAGSRGSVRLWR